MAIQNNPGLEPQNAQTQPVSQQRYNGNVNFKGQSIPVINGDAELNGEKFTVSADGRIVANQNRQFVGSIVKGQFVQSTPEIIDQLRKMGKVQ